MVVNRKREWGRRVSMVIHRRMSDPVRRSHTQETSSKINTNMKDNVMYDHRSREDRLLNRIRLSHEVMTIRFQCFPLETTDQHKKLVVR